MTIFNFVHISRFRLQINNCWIYLHFSYIIEQDVCFLTLCDRNFSKKLAYSFLEDLSQEFYNQYGHKINTATRPYSFIEFGKLKNMQTICFAFRHSFSLTRWLTAGIVALSFYLFADTYIQKAKKTYTDSRGRRNLSTLNTELQDVQRIMVQNIDDVLQRGVVMTGKHPRLDLILFYLFSLFW